MGLWHGFSTEMACLVNFQVMCYGCGVKNDLET